MKNVEFENTEIKKLYSSIINAHKGISGIILLLIQESRPIRIKDIITNEYGIEIIIQRNDERIVIITDFLKKKIYLKKPTKAYSEIYDDYARRVYLPTGYLYQNGTRAIVKTLLFKSNPDENNTYNYEITDNGIHYSVIIKNKNSKLLEEDIIQKILYREVKYTTIRDVLLAFMDNISINSCDIRIADSKGSNITIDDGKITKYIEFYEVDGEYQKIYLENNKFYIEKKVKEDYQDNLTSYIKKIGER